MSRFVSREQVLRAYSGMSKRDVGKGKKLSCVGEVPLPASVLTKRRENEKGNVAVVNSRIVIQLVGLPHDA